MEGNHPTVMDHPLKGEAVLEAVNLLLLMGHLVREEMVGHLLLTDHRIRVEVEEETVLVVDLAQASKNNMKNVVHTLLAPIFYIKFNE